MSFKPFNLRNRNNSKDFRWKKNRPNFFGKGKSIKQFFTQKRGEIATALTLIAVGLMTLGIFAGTRLAQNDTDTRSRAQTSCPIGDYVGNPSLSSDGKYCIVKITYTPSASNLSPTTLTCALINPNLPATNSDSQLIARQDPNTPDTYDYFSGTDTGRFPLIKASNLSSKLTLSGNDNYRLVVYDWTNPSNCVLENNIPASTVNSLYGGGSVVQPTPTSGVQPTSPPQQASNTPVPPTPTFTPIPTPQCVTIGNYCATREECSGQSRSWQAGYGCSSINPNYVCCFTPSQTPPPTYTPTPIPTRTPAPTNRPIPPIGGTNTPTPTAIPTISTPTPIPALLTTVPKASDLTIDSCSDIRVYWSDNTHIFFYYKTPLPVYYIKYDYPETKTFRFANLLCRPN